MSSILKDVKEGIGHPVNDSSFDTEIITHINSVFSDLNQIGVGPDEGYEIEDELNEWSEFLQDNKKLNSVKSYMCLRVKLIFDPPLSSSVLASMERQIDKLEWRLNNVT